MSGLLLDGLVLFAAICVAFGGVAILCWIVEVIDWQLEQRRRKREVLPQPEWRARVHRRWNVPL